MNAYHKIILTLCFLFCISNVFSQNLTDTAKINFIKTQFAEINQNLKSYKKVEKEDTVETTDGNQLTLYYDAGKIKKLEARYYGESGQSLCEYYFSDQKLIFCYWVLYKYNKPYYVKGGGKVASTTEKRIYLNKGKIFLVKNKPATSKNPDVFTEDPQKEASRLIGLK